MKKYLSVPDAIRDLYGTGRTIASKRNVAGGDINEAAALTLDDGTVLFMKSNTQSFLPCFVAEAQGLEAIRAVQAIGVPEVLALGTDAGCSFLLMEYVGGAGQIRDYWETFAQELAGMHSADIGLQYGFASDNWIGARKQINTVHTSWISFYRDCRLQPQFDAADHFFSSGDRRRAERLLSSLDRYLIEPEKPSLVHGDLWAGNMITGNDGKGWLIDPAVYYGSPEVDIAMTELFGGYPHRFYECYRETGMLPPGYEDRRDLYHLYQLLNHLNMFGSGYLGSVQRILKKYAG